MKNKLLLILVIFFSCSCSSIKDMTKINNPKDGLHFTYDAKKGTLVTKYKLNKNITFKY